MASIQLEPELLEGRAGGDSLPGGRVLDAHGLLVRRRALVRRTLIAADLLAVAGAFFVALIVFGPIGGSTAPFEFRLLLASLPAWIAVASVNDLYRPDTERTHHPTTNDLVGIFQLVTVGTLLFYGGLSVGLHAPLDPAPELASWILAIVLIVLGRVCARSWFRRRPAYSQRTIIVGAGDVGQRLARKVMHHPEYGIELVGFVDDAPKPKAAGLDRLDVLGRAEELLEIVKALGVERVIVAFSGDAPEATLAATRELTHHDVRVDVVPRLFDLYSPNMTVDTLEGFPILTLPPSGVSRASDVAKRAMDIVVATIAHHRHLAAPRLHRVARAP